MPEFAVSEEKQKALRERMAELGVREEDLEERFVRSSGAGGQHVNKAATCVWLRHLPTGVEVKCMRERSQSVNRFLARRELVEKLAARAGLATTADRQRERVRRQKARQKRRSAAKYGGDGPKENDE